MWLITKFGFFSIVQQPGQQATGTLTVRGRVRADLEALREQHLSAMGPIEADGGTDYKYRAVAPAAQVAAAMCGTVADIDYSNFKDAVAAEQGSQRSGLYHELWDTLWKLDEFEESERAATEVDLSQVTAPTPDPDTARPRGTGNRFIDTVEDFACWGLPAPEDAKQPAKGGTDASKPACPEGGDEDDSAKATAFGGVVFDKAGRVLLRKPTGEFDGYAWTFPKGARNRANSPRRWPCARSARRQAFSPRSSVSSPACSAGARHTRPITA